jgi:hypothetical protein
MSKALDGQQDHKCASIVPVNVANSFNSSAWQHQNGQVVVKEDPINKSAQMMAMAIAGIYYSDLLNLFYCPQTSDMSSN